MAISAGTSEVSGRSSLGLSCPLSLNRKDCEVQQLRDSSDMKWNVIWQVDPIDTAICVEQDWFNEITSLVPIASVQVDYNTKPLLKTVLPCSIICASCPNQTNISDLVQYLRYFPKPRVLYHMSDEFVKIGADLYQHCELVIRNGSAHFDMVGDQKFIQIPLGYVTGLRNSSRVLQKSSDRPCSFAFLGTIKHERESVMLPALRKIRGPHFVRKTKSFAEATKYFGDSTIPLYKNAVFVPNPRGNWNPECFRLYEALEWGCIPLIKRYSCSKYHENYHDKLLGNHPIPTFDDWEESAEFANDLLSDKAALDALQAEVFAWWHTYKSKLQSIVTCRLANLAT